MSSNQNIKNNEAFIWSVADLLRGQYKPYEYQDVVLPLVVLRRLDCVLEPTKAAVLAKHAEIKDKFADVCGLQCLPCHSRIVVCSKTHEGLAKAIQIFEGIDDGALDELITKLLNEGE